MNNVASILLNKKTLYYLSFSVSSLIFANSAYRIIQYLLSQKKTKELGRRDEFIEVDFILKNGSLTQELAIKIAYTVQKVCDMMMKEQFPNNNNERQKAITNPNLYFQITKKYLIEKEKILKISIEKVLKVLNYKFTIDQIQNKLNKIPQNVIEEKSGLYYKPEFDITPTKDVVKEAYLYYSRILIHEFDEAKNILHNLDNINDANEKEEKNLKVKFIYQKAEDLLIINYNLSEREIIYFLFYYNLQEDNDIIAQRKRLSEINKKYCHI